ncbi:MAG: PilZ domain-containing protein [Armatimonadetes bacterium]|nr:PilZ domain-containing protein [Armatimonadota bacterium]
MRDRMLEGLKSLVIGQGSIDTEERRRLLRVRCELPVTCRVDERDVECVVTDLGVEGMRLRLSDRLDRDQLVSIVYAETSSEFSRHEVRCRVAWCHHVRGESYHAGVVLVEEPDELKDSWVHCILQELGLDEGSIYERRHFVRIALTIPVELRHIEGSAPPDSELVNLGARGALVRCPAELQEDCDIELKLGPLGELPPLVLRGQVVSRKPGGEGEHFFGVRFVDPDPDQVKLLGGYVFHMVKSG